MTRVTGPLAGYVVLAVLALPGLAASAPDALPALELAPPAEPVATVPAPAPPGAPAPAAQPPVPAVAAAEPAPERQPRNRRDAVTVAASGTVVISDFKFTPGTISITAGDSVTWRNDGPTPHSATASDGSFDTGIMRKGASGSHTFDSAGTFAYICTPHPNMKGTV